MKISIKTLRNFIIESVADVEENVSLDTLNRDYPAVIQSLQNTLAQRVEDGEDETDITLGSFEFRSYRDESIVSAWGADAARRAGGKMKKVLVYMDDAYLLAYRGPRIGWDSID